MDKVLIKRPGADWIVETCDDLTLSYMQGVVGGSIEMMNGAVGLPDPFTMYANANGKHLNLDYNCTINNVAVFGTFMICGSYKGEETPLTDDEVSKIKKFLVYEDKPEVANPNEKFEFRAITATTADDIMDAIHGPKKTMLVKEPGKDWTIATFRGQLSQFNVRLLVGGEPAQFQEQCTLHGGKKVLKDYALVANKDEYCYGNPTQPYNVSFANIHGPFALHGTIFIIGKNGLTADDLNKLKKLKIWFNEHADEHQFEATALKIKK